MSTQYAYYDREEQDWADEPAKAEEQDALDDADEAAKAEATAFERWLDRPDGQDTSISKPTKPPKAAATATSKATAMREIKVRFGRYWVEMPADSPVSALSPLIAGTRLRIRWNNRISDCTGRKGFVEVYRP